MRWYRVSSTTVQRYKSGGRRPSRAVQRLFILHRDQQVLGDAWAGWRVAGDPLVTPEGLACGMSRNALLMRHMSTGYVRSRPCTA